MIKFELEGIKPVSQGSMKVINGHVIHSKGSELAVYRSMLALKAREAGATLIDGPVGMRIRFQFARPKTVKREYPTTPPDIDKNIRAVFDSLTGICYEDDSQVIAVEATKNYGNQHKVTVEVFPYSEFDCL